MAASKFFKAKADIYILFLLLLLLLLLLPLPLLLLAQPLLLAAVHSSSRQQDMANTLSLSGF